MNESEKAVFEFIKAEIKKAETDEFAIDNELGEFLQDSASQGKESAFDELNEIVKAIDDMDELSEKLEGNELDLDDADDEAMEFDEFEIAAKDNKFEGPLACSLRAAHADSAQSIDKS